jgi:ribosomal protein S18 acetylase RimI-like enzyme
MKMYSSYLFITLFCVPICSALDATQCAASHKSRFSIRLATIEDLKPIIALDTTISYEYFKPLLLHYPEYEGKEQDVEKLLADEIEADITWFTSCISMEKQQRLYIACDDTTLVGFVACHKQNDTIVVIDLLMIEAGYRGKGIGKQLVQTCIQTFPEASSCMLVVLDNNKPARAIYERMGFVLMDEKPLFVQEKYPESRYLCYYLPLLRLKP